VFGKVKNGQKKCPISENPEVLLKQDSRKSNLDQNAHNANNFIQKMLP
jgi:hypothetical protein